MPRTQAQARIRSLYAEPETTNIPVLIGTERPPPDTYDKYPDLVPPHFSPTPALTNIDKVYTKYGNSYQKEKWRPLSIEAKASAQRLYRKHGLAHNIRFKCGLYIVGSETDMQDEGRDRMMVLVFELSEQQLSFWDLLHTDAIKLLDQLELSGEPGVCVRYYHQVERSPMIEVVQGSHNTRPVAGSSIARQPDESMDTWLQRRMRSPDFPEALRERAEEMIQRRNEGDHGANEQRVTMSEAARSLSSMMSFEEQMGLIARTPTPLGLQTSAYNMANISAERSTTIRRLTTSRRPLFERMPSAYRRRSTPNTGSGITGTRNAIVDYYNSMSDPFQSSAGVDDEEDGAPFSDPDDGTDVSVLRIAVSDKEEESLLPRFPGPALEYR